MRSLFPFSNVKREKIISSKNDAKKAILSNKWGYISVIVVTIIFGICYTFNKILLQDLHPLALSASVYVIGSVFLCLIHYSPFKDKILSILNTNSDVETFISRKDYGIILTTAILGSVVAPLIYLYGLNQITAVNASLLMNVEILFIIIIGLFLLRESVMKKDLLGFLFLIVGTTFLATNNQIGNFSISNDFGNLLIIAAAFFWSIDTSLSKFLSNKHDLIFITTLKCSIGGLILFILSLTLKLSFNIPLNHLPYLLFIGLMGIGFSLILIYFAIRQIGSIRTGSLFSLSSLFGAVFAFLILHEPFTLTQLLFGLLMILGVLILYKNGRNNLQD